MLKEKDGKIVVPKRFMEWLKVTEKRKNQSLRIALINRLGWLDSCGERYSIGVSLLLNDDSFHDLDYFVLTNKQYLTRALLDEKEFTSEEEKKYYMMAPNGFTKRHRYLNFDTDTNEYFVGDKYQICSCRTQFTQSEIDAMPQKFRDFFEKVEVEE